MSTEVGNIKNKETGESLGFPMAPSRYGLSREYEFSSEAVIGGAAPAVSFRCGGNTILSFSIALDSDADSSMNIRGALSFLKSLDKVKEETLSVPEVAYKMGPFTFDGFVRSYRYEVSRFNAEGEATSIEIHFELFIERRI